MGAGGGFCIWFQERRGGERNKGLEGPEMQGLFKAAHSRAGGPWAHL